LAAEPPIRPGAAPGPTPASAIRRRRTSSRDVSAKSRSPGDRLTLSFTYFGDYPVEEVYGVAATTYDSVTADFNGDGRLDLFTMYSPEDIYSYGFVY